MVAARCALRRGGRAGGASSSLWILNADGSGWMSLTDAASSDTSPQWPDGSKIASARDGNLEIYLMNADGTSPVNLTHHSANDDSPSFSPDGAQIAFQSDRDGNLKIYVMNADGPHPSNVTHNPAPDYAPAWGP